MCVYSKKNTYVYMYIWCAYIYINKYTSKFVKDCIYMCRNIDVCAWMYIDVYVYTYIYIYMYVYIHIYVYIHLYKYICVKTNIFIYMYIFVFMWTCIYICGCVYIYINMYVHIYIYAYIFLCKYVRVSYIILYMYIYIYFSSEVLQNWSPRAWFKWCFLGTCQRLPARAAKMNPMALNRSLISCEIWLWCSRDMNQWTFPSILPVNMIT